MPRHLLPVSLVVVATAVTAVAVASASQSRAELAIIPPKQCGKDVVWKKQDPDKVLKTLPARAQARYGAYPYEVRATPWANFKKKPGPWKIGYISFPTDNPWKVSMLAQLKKEFAAAKKKGLVEGSLQTYIQPSWATATPEQQVTAIQQMVRNGVDGILIHPLNSIAETKAFDAAGKAGVPIVLTSDVAPNSKYAVNVFAQNNSPTYAGVLSKMKANGLIGNGKTVNLLQIRGIPGVTVEQAFYDASMADIKACPGVNVIGTVWGKWNAATAKAEILKFIASHPQKIDVVFQSAVGGGVIEAFEQAGRDVPIMNFGGSSGGDLAWWAENKNTVAMRNAVGGQFGGFQVGHTTFGILLRILDGKGLKIRDLHLPASIVTNANIDKFATPGKDVTWIGDIRGPVDGWANDKMINDYFKKPGVAGSK
jgi:ribose transport system substrate-binding protein